MKKKTIFNDIFLEKKLSLRNQSNDLTNRLDKKGMSVIEIVSQRMKAESRVSFRVTLPDHIEVLK